MALLISISIHCCTLSSPLLSSPTPLLSPFPPTGCGAVREPHSAVEQYVSRTPDGNFSGFCVEVFQRAMALLPYPVGFSLVAYDFKGSSYEDLIRRVANKEYDGAVGDITVTADRAQTVDFTQPFMESGLGLVVPVLQGDPANPWAFLYPFTGSMWALMIASIVFTAAVIWYLEHNQNLDFGGGPYHHQLTTSLW
ncbi:unnamed protein product [Closterium sp. Naga37s-1]|nr:unnamed protein product [Closterium sp. Naga37s-1]